MRRAKSSGDAFKNGGAGRDDSLRNVPHAIS